MTGCVKRYKSIHLTICHCVLAINRYLVGTPHGMFDMLAEAATRGIFSPFSSFRCDLSSDLFRVETKPSFSKEQRDFVEGQIDSSVAAVWTSGSERGVEITAQHATYTILHYFLEF